MTRIRTVEPDSCFTDGSHRFWYDNKPVLQIYRFKGQFALVTLEQQLWLDVVPEYPTANECQSIWETQSWV